MGDSSTGCGTAQAEGTVPSAVAPVPCTAPDAVTEMSGKPKRNHNRNAMSGKPKEPLTTDQQHQAATLSAAGWSQSKISKTIGRSRKAVKHYLDTPEVMAEVSDERQELVELYRQKARDCVVAIDDEKIAKASALQLCTLRPAAIKTVSDWAISYRRFWEESFDKLEVVVNQMKKDGGQR